ncbi:hypothetical protein L3X38_043214 [Prunus dulcis]|uniref:Plastocyanin-like domain-containing protein n=1 Tax=Prunus dulcis TaxID=3755 RepID=A0AAD4UXD0_PRUDU|nr:hypothetical protein L3X38_043214 [Prunus dulcis]
MAARPFTDAPVSIDNKTATGILQYKGIPNTVQPVLLQLPAINNTVFALSFNAKLRSLNTAQFPASVPLKVDRHLFYTIGLGCFKIIISTPREYLPQISQTALQHLSITLVHQSLPTLAVGTKQGTRLSKLAFNSTVELVVQDTNLLTVESHPFDLHGYNFFVVGTGVGNFDPKKDPAKYNLVDPPERNTIGVPAGGWVAMRFRADNPGVWFMHCHLELHTCWGLKTAFIVENGKDSDHSVLPPPTDLPPC